MAGPVDAPSLGRAFAVALVLRPLLIVPMAPSGPLGGSAVLPAALAAVFALSLALAAGVWLRVRVMLALAVLSAIAGVPLAVLGALLGLPMPWPFLLLACNVALVPVGIAIWEAPDPSRSDKGPRRP